MKKRILQIGLILGLGLLGVHSAKSQDTITICKDVRNILFTITTTAGKAVAWQWTLTGTTFSGKLTDSVCGPVPYNTVGVFSATCLVTFSTGKDSLHKFVIVVFDGTVKPIILSDTSICGKVNLVLDADNVGITNIKYKWTPNGQNTRTIAVAAAGTYGVSAYTVDDYSYIPGCPTCLACDSTNEQITVTQVANPPLDLGPDRFICNSNPVTLDAGPGMALYAWLPNNENTQSILATLAGLYTVTITNADGCKSTDQIYLKDSCPMYVFIPNAFTPDGNGVNDMFNWVGNMTMKSFHFKIYNRWGEKMFETEDPLTQGWNGQYQNKPAMPGVYAYWLECVDTNEVRHYFEGNITLIK